MRGLTLSRICAWCLRERSQDGEWRESEPAQLGLSPATHGICPDCLEKATARAMTSQGTR